MPSFPSPKLSSSRPALRTSATLLVILCAAGCGVEGGDNEGVLSTGVAAAGAAGAGASGGASAGGGGSAAVAVDSSASSTLAGAGGAQPTAAGGSSGAANGSVPAASAGAAGSSSGGSATVDAAAGGSAGTGVATAGAATLPVAGAAAVAGGAGGAAGAAATGGVAGMGNAVAGAGGSLAEGGQAGMLATGGAGEMEAGGAASDGGSGAGDDNAAGASTVEEPDTAAEACPADATFCSGFESDVQPEGSIYNRNGAPAEWTTDFVIDTAVKNSGNSSLRVKTTTEEAQSAYKMLAVPAPGAVFWMRTYIRANGVIGQGTTSSSEHNRLLGAASGSDTNTTDMLEIADDCGLAFNSHDAVFRAGSDDGTCDEAATLRLEADTWYCLEAYFDGTSGNAQLYIDGELKIDAVGWAGAQGNFTHLKFGVDHLHALDRSVWYDDMAVGPTRAGCL